MKIVRLLLYCSREVSTKSSHPVSLQRKTPLRTIRIIPPPVRHRNNLACPKEQENQQHIEIKPSITRRSQDEVIPSPKTISISEGPVHDNKAANEGG